VRCRAGRESHKQGHQVTPRQLTWAKKAEARGLAEVARLNAAGLDSWGFPVAVRAVTLTPAHPPAPSPRRQAGRGSLCGDALDTGLRALTSAQQTGQTFTTREIAAACGVDKETIRLIQRSAIRKLRARLGPAHHAAIRDALSNLT
jgi:hypothetical protein